MKTNFILYVRDQKASTEFYSVLLNLQPSLNVPGMTEFQLSQNAVLGLMPEVGVKRLLGESIQDPELNNGNSRCELYFIVDSPEVQIDRAIKLGAKLLSPIADRNWGDRAGYIMDSDGHIIAFAAKTHSQIGNEFTQ